jgi:hypothetical protein
MKHLKKQHSPIVKLTGFSQIAFLALNNNINKNLCPNPACRRFHDASFFISTKNLINP